MDPVRFDRLAKSLSRPETRRRVFGVLAAVPVVGGLLGILSPEETEAAGRRKRRKTRNKRRSGDDKKNRKGKHKKKQPTCTPTTCAAQGKTCGSLPDGCGKTLDCSPCTCATGCHPVCQVCNPATRLCDDVANDTPCDDGDLCTINDVCTDGVCAGSPKCGGGQRCVGGACVCDATSCPTGCCDAQGQCQVGTEAGACGSIGGGVHRLRHGRHL